uniref:Uncharacterized protein n=1 Tax=Glossina morsitans morsitans TaxID=37546 RepID=A0A1B0GFV1_GLOMM
KLIQNLMLIKNIYTL